MSARQYFSCFLLLHSQETQWREMPVRFCALAARLLSFGCIRDTFHAMKPKSNICVLFPLQEAHSH
jgi:hypothetical protein